MDFYKRILEMRLPPRQSAFLWGARRTGKTTFLKSTFPEAVTYDLLHSDLFLRLAKSPHLLREEVLELTKTKENLLIIIDEVQKVPPLLDEVHWLIENTNAQFILCGSSARKLKNQGVNKLGGRAWKYHLFPLVYPEISDFDLLRVFQKGAIPAHYHSSNIKKDFKSYIEDYLTLEIQAEGLVRNLPAFSRFIDSLSFSHGEMINYNNIARDTGVDAKTVKEYFYILVDTLVGYLISPYRKHVSRQIITEAPKFYLFDVGLANSLRHSTIEVLKGADAGKAFEHYIFLEIMAYKQMNDCAFNISYWRTKSGLEVDFILGEGEVAIEVKISSQVQKSDLTGLKAFNEEHTPKKSIVVSLDPKARTIAGEKISVYPLMIFLETLWAGDIIS